MLSHMDNDIEISRRPTLNARLAFGLQAQPRSSLDAGGYFYFNRLFTFDTPRPTTTLTGRSYYLAGTATCTAGSRHGKEALLKANLPNTLARLTGFGQVRFQQG